MSEAESLKLTIYFGERDRVDGKFLSDALLDLYGRRTFQTSVVLRGIEGFGIKHSLHTDRFLTLSEDLPTVAIAVDTRQRIREALPAVLAMTGDGLITLERARMIMGHTTSITLPEEYREATKLTIYVGRKERSASGQLAYLDVVELLHRRQVAGATVQLGVDGTVHGARRRARFFGSNAEVPLMIISIGTGASIQAVLPELCAMLSRPLLTLEAVRLVKRDGHLLSSLESLPETDEYGLPVWQKLMVYAGEQSRHGSHPLYIELIHRLRLAGAAGATAVRGIWGYHGDHQPHGDKLFTLRRHVPVVTAIVDTPERIQQWFAIVDELTTETGLVTSEMVPASHAVGPGIRQGGLHLAQYPPDNTG